MTEKLRDARQQALSTAFANEQLGSVLDSVTDACFVVNPEWRVTFANATAAGFLGRSREDAVGSSLWEMLPALVGTPIHEQCQWGMEQRASVEIDWYASASRRWFGFHAFPATLGGFVIFVRDVTAHKHDAEERRRIIAAVESTSDAVVMTDLDGQSLYHNRAFIDRYGYTPTELDAHGGPLVLFTSPATADEVFTTIKAGGSWHGEVDVRSKAGRVVPTLLRADSITDVTGQFVGLVGVLTDISERQRLEVRQRLLIEAGTILGSSLDYETTLTHVARLCVPELADFCSVNIVEGCDIRRLAVAHANPEKDRRADALKDAGRLDIDEPYGVPRAIRTSQSVLYASIPDDVTALIQSRDGALIHEIGMSSALFVPLIVESNTIGALAFVYSDSGRQFTPDDVAFYEELARRAAQAMENARLHREVREAEAQYRSLIENIPGMVYVAAADNLSHLLYQNPQIAHLLGYSFDEWLADPQFWFTRLHPEDVERVRASDEHAIATGEPFVIEYRVISRDGRIVWWRDAAKLNRGADGTPLHWHGILTDITEREQAEAAHRESEARFRATFEQAAVGVGHVGLDGQWLRVNQRLCDLVGYAHDELLQLTFQDVTHPDDLEIDLDYLRRLLAGEIPHYALDKRYRHKDGSVVWGALTRSLVRDQCGAPAYFISVVEDITQRKQMEAQLAHQAFHDALTGLPNRVLLLDRIEQALVYRERHDQQVAILFLDLDNFKVINDSLGHGTGDQLLQQVAQRLTGCVRPEDTVARLGGDEFAVLVRDVSDASDVADIATRIIAVLEAPLAVNDRMVVVTPSIGIAVTTGLRDRPDDLLQRADMAMYRAKTSGKCTYALFDMAMHDTVMRRLELEHDLRAAIEQEQFVLYYQPKVALDSGEVVAVEALVRWQHPTQGLVSPADFIPVAEETGLIVPLGEWVLREACRQAYAWQSFLLGKAPLRVNVNLSARQFRQPDLVAKIERMLTDTGLAPNLLVIEITESAVMDEPEQAEQRLHELKALGIEVAIDDFGTGYSSLAYLKRFSVDVLKIDRTFVAGLGIDPSDTAIVTATIGLAHALGLRVVAEGIETHGQVALLRDLNCDIGQGYYLGRPVPAAQLMIEARDVASDDLLS